MLVMKCEIYDFVSTKSIAAICDECHSCGYYEGNIYLAVGCPTTMLTSQRESTREYF